MISKTEKELLLKNVWDCLKYVENCFYFDYGVKSSLIEFNYLPKKLTELEAAAEFFRTAISDLSFAYDVITQIPTNQTELKRLQLAQSLLLFSSLFTKDKKFKQKNTSSNLNWYF